MAELDIANATASSNDGLEDYSISSQTTDGATGNGETSYQNTNWSKWLGYYKDIPELKIAVDTKANWVIGNGFEADEATSMLLNSMKGNGKDSFNSILENMERTCYIGEDSYAEIIRDEEGIFINLKPLDPSSIKVIQNAQGRIVRYEQTNKNKKTSKKFKPEEIFVLSHNRVADEMHGVSIIPSVQWVIDARNESMTDWKKVLHRNVEPLWIFHLDTDDTTQIASFKTKMDNARDNGENMYIPKGAVEPELVTTAANASLNPLTWIQQLNDYFFQAVGVPQIIVGNAKAFTDASGKIVYLAFEQRIKGRQKYVEEQILNQLNVWINLKFPASLQTDAVSDTPTEEAPEQAAQPNDTKSEMEGAT